MIYTICNEPGCGELIPSNTPLGRCPTHQAAVHARKRAKRRASGYYSKHWQRLRKAALARDGHTCQRCGAPATTVHIDPRLRANHYAATLVDCTSLCHPCHGSIDTRRRHAEINAQETGATESQPPAPGLPLIA